MLYTKQFQERNKYIWGFAHIDSKVMEATEQIFENKLFNMCCVDQGGGEWVITNRQKIIFPEDNHFVCYTWHIRDVLQRAKVIIYYLKLQTFLHYLPSKLSKISTVALDLFRV